MIAEIANRQLPATATTVPFFIASPPRWVATSLARRRLESPSYNVGPRGPPPNKAGLATSQSSLDEGPPDEGLLDCCEIIVPFLGYQDMGRRIRHLPEVDVRRDRLAAIQRRILPRPNRRAYSAPAPVDAQTIGPERTLEAP